MQCWSLIKAYDPQIELKETKIHFAVFNGKDDPLDEYRCGRFADWQSYQTRMNFELDHVVSLIQQPEPKHWLFAGAYDCRGRSSEGEGYRYDMGERPGCY